MSIQRHLITLQIDVDLAPTVAIDRVTRQEQQGTDLVFFGPGRRDRAAETELARVPADLIIAHEQL